MTKKILSVMFVAVVFGFGFRETAPLNKCVITQNPVCGSQYPDDQYSIMTYVTQQKIVIPALEQMFIPQGIAYWPERDWLIISGYFCPVFDVSGGALLAVEAAQGCFVGIYFVEDSTGARIDGHFSGIAVTENDLYVSHNSTLLQIPLQEFDGAESFDKVRAAKKHKTGIVDAGCNYSSGILWVCEHFRHDEQGAEAVGKMIGYQIDPNRGLVPACAFFVPEKVQGITVTEDGLLCFSISYGRKNPSRITVYSDPRVGVPDSRAMVGGAFVPLWDLNRDKPLHDLSAPPMSEGCCAVAGDVYLIFESAAFYYRAYDLGYRSTDPTDRIWKLDTTLFRWGER